MKFFHIFFLLVGLVSPPSLWARPESQPESKKFDPQPGATLRAKSTMEEALVLMEIYTKIRKITGNDDRSQLKAQLDQLNSALDEVLAFKSSFTSKKLEKVEKQLNHVKSCISDIGASNVNQMKNQGTKLLNSLLDLISVIMEPAPDEKQTL